MKHLGSKIIYTERLTLRPFTINDSEMMFSNWANDDEVTKYLPWNSHSSIKVTKEILTEWTNNYNNPDFYQWCIDYYNTAIGSISVIEINEKLRSCEIGYCIGKKWWHNSFTSEALMHVKNFLINEVGFEHIWAWHHINNPNSGFVLAKCGFSYVGEVNDCQKYMNTDSKIIIYETKKNT